MLDVSILLNHPDLVLMQEAVDVSALLYKARSQVGLCIRTQVDQSVENHFDQNICILNFANCGHQAHKLVHQP